MPMYFSIRKGDDGKWRWDLTCTNTSEDYGIPEIVVAVGKYAHDTAQGCKDDIKCVVAATPDTDISVQGED